MIHRVYEARRMLLPASLRFNSLRDEWQLNLIAATTALDVEDQLDELPGRSSPT